MSKKSQEPQKQGLVRESEFKGKPIMALYRAAEDKHPLQFGLVKAGLILSHVDEIKAFCAKHQGKEAVAA